MRRTSQIGLQVECIWRSLPIQGLLSEVRAPWQHLLLRTSESHGHWQTYSCSAAFDLKFLDGIRRLHRRNFKSAALARKLVKRERQIPNSTRILNLLVVF
jgi:hypothetical protein